jgi:hypothetical protein
VIDEMRTETGPEPAVRACVLQDALGRVEPCLPGICPFWEAGGAGLEGRCRLDRLGFDLAGEPERAAELAGLRLRLLCRQRGADESTPSLFYRLAR